MSKATLAYTGELTITTCWCGMHQAIPADLYAFAKRTGKAVWCPLGHEWVIKESDLTREKKRAERAEESLRFERQRREAEADLRRHTEHKLRAQKGATTKARKRHASGVCPCCSRTFQQLQRHMATKHPDYEPSRGV